MSDLVITQTDAVLTVELNRPDKLNSVTDAMWAELGEALARVRDDEQIRAVRLRGAGGVFSAGSDVSSFVGHPEPLGPRIEACNQVLLALHELPVPTLAQVDGLAGGSGANLALLCDFVIASERSRFAELFTHIGLSLDTGSSWLLPRLAGERRAREIALLGEWIDASSAYEWGLITAVVADAELDARCEALLTRLTDLSRAASAGSKKLLNDSWGHALRDALTAETASQLHVIETPAARARIGAFLNKSRRKRDP
jgi:enoyl-CoA hydratase/carnithine racemase